MASKEFFIGQVVRCGSRKFVVVEDIDKKLKCNTYNRPDHPQGKYLGRNNKCSECAFSRRELTGFTSVVACGLSTPVLCHGELRSDKKNVIFVNA